LELEVGDSKRLTAASIAIDRGVFWHVRLLRLASQAFSGSWGLVPAGDGSQ